MSRLNLIIFVATFGLTAGQVASQEPVRHRAPVATRVAVAPLDAISQIAAVIPVVAASVAPAIAWAEAVVPSVFVPPMVPPLDSWVFSTVPPRGSHQGDPADSLYKRAREELNQGDYGRAAGHFRQLVDRYPKSAYAADALYWHAFALYRLGARPDLRNALAALSEQKRHYPNAPTRGDADALAARINGELAREGDADAAESIAAQARAAAESVAGGVEVARATVEATREATRASLDAARAAMEATAAAMPRGVRISRDEPLPQECEAQRDKLDMQVAALNALLQMDGEQATPVLRDVLKRRDVCSVRLRRQAVFLVSQKHTAETEDILVDLVRNDPDPGVKEQAVFWLSQVHSEKALTALESILNTSQDRRMQERALFALSQHHSPGAAEALRKYATNESNPADLREKAIFWIGQSHSPESDQFLRDLFRRSTSAAQKERILFSISQSRSAANDKFLADVATDASQPPETRKRALFWASQSGSIGAPELGRMYDTGDTQMKEQIIFSLSQRRDGIDKLLDIARNEKDAKLRSRAIFWIGQSRDPRAVKLLQEIVSQ